MEKGKCPLCEKEFNGINQKHIDSQILQHLISKHPEDVEIKVKGKVWKK